MLGVLNRIPTSRDSMGATTMPPIYMLLLTSVTHRSQRSPMCCSAVGLLTKKAAFFISGSLPSILRLLPQKKRAQRATRQKLAQRATREQRAQRDGYQRWKIYLRGEGRSLSLAHLAPFAHLHPNAEAGVRLLSDFCQSQQNLQLYGFALSLDSNNAYALNTYFIAE